MHYEYDVVLATYNGENYIDEQLYSIVNQSIPPSKIIISDDSSRDKSLSICNYWSTQSLIPFLILPQPSCRLGSCRNFERLLTFSSSNYVMLADQDDIWDLNKAEKLFKRMNALEKVHGKSHPLLVYSDLRLIDHSGKNISYSFYEFQCLSPSRDDFVSIGLQNIVTGCSCLVNQSCIKAALPFPSHVIMHDWWLAMVASRLGYLAFEESPCVSYRQHSSNLVGADGYPFLLFKRFRLLFTLKLSNIMYRTIRQLQALVMLHPSPNPVVVHVLITLTEELK